MSKIPTKWAAVEIGWGNENKHIYSIHDWDIDYFPTEEAARVAAKETIASGDAKMMAVLEVKTILVPKAVEFDEVL